MSDQIISILLFYIAGYLVLIFFLLILLFSKK